MAIPVPTVDEITGKTVMQKIRSLVNNYLGFAQEVADEVETFESGQIIGIVTNISESTIVTTFTFGDNTTQTITLPTATKQGSDYLTGLLSLAQYNEIKASINDAEYSSTDSLFTITFTDNNNETETITVPIVGNRAGLLTSAMYTAITDGLSNLQISLAGKVDKVEGKGLSTNDFTDAEKTKLAGISGALQYRGSVVNYTDLPTTGQNVGDVWNVENGYLTYPAGTNFAWNGTEWDALGGAIDLSDFVTNGQLTSALSEKQNELTPGTGIVIQNDVISSTVIGAGLFTEQVAGNIKGSTDDYKVKSNIDGTGSVNGLPELATDVMNNISDISTLQNLVSNKATLIKINSISEFASNVDANDIVLGCVTSDKTIYFAGVRTPRTGTLYSIRCVGITFEGYSLKGGLTFDVARDELSYAYYQTYTGNIAFGGGNTPIDWTNTSTTIYVIK